MIISVSGLRGIAGEDLTDELIFKYTHAFGNFCNNGKVVVGRDTRPSGEMVKRSCFKGLLSAGCEVVDLGILPTPSILFSTKELRADGGISITASHNPIEWNGLKFVNSKGLFLNKKEYEKFERMVKETKVFPVCLKATKSIGKPIDRHIKKILSLEYLDIPALKKRRFKVIIDTCNGAGYEIGPKLLQKLGCEVIRMNCNPFEPFPRPPEPNLENLMALKRRVIKENADVGFGLDPDGDRLAVCSKKDFPLGEEYTVVLAASLILGKKKGCVVTNLSTTKLIDDVATEKGASVIRTRVGEANVVEAILKNKAIIGGEGNGGVILPDVHLTRDASTGMALILQYILERRESIENILDKFPKYYIVKKKISIKTDRVLRLGRLKEKFGGAEINEEDGLKFSWKDSWVHIRKSGTEPIMRIIAEAKTEKEAQSLIKQVQSYLNLAPRD